MQLAAMVRIAGMTAVLGTTWIGVARANPIAVDDMRGLQVPESMHVQLTYLCGVPDMCVWPAGLERNGQELEVTWLEPGALTINAGSGLVEYEARQACDCDVPAGTYTYALTYPEGVTPDYPFEVSVTVTDPPPAPPEPDTVTDTGTGSMDPWDIPEPPWPQGTDCSAWCSEDHGDGSTGTGTGGGSGTDGGGGDGTGGGGGGPTGTGGDTAGPAESDGGGSKGCAVADLDDAPKALWLGLCAVALGFRRRRRARC